jgi:hypothetical protein
MKEAQTEETAVFQLDETGQVWIHLGVIGMAKLPDQAFEIQRGNFRGDVVDSIRG